MPEEAKKEHTPNKSKVTSELLTGLEMKNGQERVLNEQLISKAGWYNMNGKHVGWGDLSTGDVEKLMTKLPEPLILLDNHDFEVAEKFGWGYGLVVDHCAGIIFPPAPHNNKIGNEFYLFKKASEVYCHLTLMEKNDFSYYFADVREARKILGAWRNAWVDSKV